MRTGWDGIGVGAGASSVVAVPVRASGALLGEIGWLQVNLDGS